MGAHKRLHEQGVLRCVAPASNTQLHGILLYNWHMVA